MSHICDALVTFHSPVSHAWHLIYFHCRWYIDIFLYIIDNDKLLLVRHCRTLCHSSVIWHTRIRRILKAVCNVYLTFFIVIYVKVHVTLRKIILSWKCVTWVENSDFFFETAVAKGLKIERMGTSLYKQ